MTDDDAFEITGETTIEDDFESRANRHSDVIGVILELFLNAVGIQMQAGINLADRFVSGRTVFKPGIYARFRFVRNQDGTVRIGCGDDGLGMSKDTARNELVDPGHSALGQFFSRFGSGGMAALCWAEKKISDSPLPLLSGTSPPEDINLDNIDTYLNHSEDEYRESVYEDRDRTFTVYTRAEGHDPVKLQGPIQTGEYGGRTISDEEWKKKVQEYKLPAGNASATGTIVEVSLPAATLQETARNADAQRLFPLIRDLCNTMASHGKIGAFLEWMDPQIIVDFQDKQLGNGDYGSGAFELIERVPVFRKGFIDTDEDQYLKTLSDNDKEESHSDIKRLYHSGFLETTLNGTPVYVEYEIGVPDQTATLEKYKQELGENGKRLLTKHKTFPGSPFEPSRGNRGVYVCANYIGVLFSETVLPKSNHPEANFWLGVVNIIPKSPEEELPLQTDREGFTTAIETTLRDLIKEEIGYTLPNLPSNLKAELGGSVSGNPKNTDLIVTENNKEKVAKELVKLYKKEWDVTMEDVVYEKEVGPAHYDVVLILSEDENVMVGAEVTDSRMRHTDLDDLWKYCYVSKEDWEVLDLYAIAYGRTSAVIDAIDNYLNDLMPETVEAPNGYDFEVHYRDAVEFLDQRDDAPEGYDTEDGIPKLN